MTCEHEISPLDSHVSRVIRLEVTEQPEWYKVENEDDDDEDDDGEPREERNGEVERVLDLLATRGHATDGVLWG